MILGFEEDTNEHLLGVVPLQLALGVGPAWCIMRNNKLEKEKEHIVFRDPNF
jgi:hypothetical protein